MDEEMQKEWLEAISEKDIEDIADEVRRFLDKCTGLANLIEKLQRTKGPHKDVAIPSDIFGYYEASTLRNGICAVQKLQEKFAEILMDNRSFWINGDIDNKAFDDLLGIDRYDMHLISDHDYQKLKDFCQKEGIREKVSNFYDTFDKEN